MLKWQLYLNNLLYSRYFSQGCYSHIFHGQVDLWIISWQSLCDLYPYAFSSSQSAVPWNFCYNNYFTKDNYQTLRAHCLSSDCYCPHLHVYCISHESAHFHSQDKLMPPTSVLCALTNVSVAIYSHALMRVHIILVVKHRQVFLSAQIGNRFMQQPTEKPLICFPHTVNCGSTKILSHTSYTEYCTSICGYKKTIQLRIKLLGGRFNNNWLTANCIKHCTIYYHEN